jgi:DNA-binding GntR family transcriptional regulator
MEAHMTSRRILAQHVILTIARDHLEGRRSDLDTLTEALGASRAEVRSVLTSLHHEGYVDVLRMRLTIEGFALGLALSDKQMPSMELEGDRPSIAA